MTKVQIAHLLVALQQLEELMPVEPLKTGDWEISKKLNEIIDFVNDLETRVEALEP